jgi:hypothetical protein
MSVVITIGKCALPAIHVCLVVLIRVEIELICK